MILSLWMFLPHNDKRLPVWMWTDMKDAKSAQKFEMWLCDSTQSLVLLSHNKMDMSWKEKIYGADSGPDVLLPPSPCPVTSLEPLALWSRLMCDMKDSCPRYLHSHSVLCPHVSPHLVFEDLEQAPPSGSLFHFPFPRLLYPPFNYLNSISFVLVF